MRGMYDTIKAAKPSAQVGWHVDHQPSSWDIVYRAEMSYEEMAPYSDFLKLILYHAVLGPRIRDWYLERFKKTILSELSLEQSLEVYYALFGYDPKAEPSLNELAGKGFSADYVYRETKRSVASANGKTKIYSGIGFNVPGSPPEDPEKIYQATPGNEAAVRYSPGSIRGIEKKVVQGNPDMAKVSTSYVERFNLSTRMHMRRFTRLTNGFSKKAANHAAAIALHLGYYNLVRIHETLRCTPAMALGVTDHPWTIAELIDKALAAPAMPPVYTPPQGTLPLGMSAAKAKGQKPGLQPKLYVIKGGRWPKK